MNFFKEFKKFTIWEILILVFLFLLIMVILSNISLNKEGFINQKRSFEKKSGSDIYDTIYVDIYDSLLYSNIKNDFEVGKIINSQEPTSHTKLLDIGCGTGHHVDLFNKNNINSLGIDLSPAMIKQAKLNYPKNKYKVCDALNSIEFPSNSFTDITCLYFTIYYIKNKKLFFENCYDWLMPGGTLVIHLVNIKKFDPIIPVSLPTTILPPQNYTSKRFTKSIVNFDQLDYNSEFVIDKNIDYNVSTLDSPNALFKETLKFKNPKKTRVNEHQLYMPSQRSILSLAKDTGFILHAQEEMTEPDYQYNYLYFLIKP